MLNLHEDWNPGTYTLQLIGVHYYDANEESRVTRFDLYMMYPKFNYNPGLYIDNSGATAKDSSFYIQKCGEADCDPEEVKEENLYYNYDIAYPIFDWW